MVSGRSQGRSMLRSRPWSSTLRMLRSKGLTAALKRGAPGAVARAAAAGCTMKPLL
jgi:hypothetical protein